MLKFRLDGLSRNVRLVAQTFLGCCVLVPAFLVVLPFWICKICVILLARIFYPRFRPISTAAVLFALENVAQNDMDNRRDVLTNIGLCIELEASSTEIDLNEFVEKFENNLLKSKDLESQIWKLKSHLIRFCGYTFWREAPNFSILNHVKKVNIAPEKNLQEYLNTWIRMPFASANSPLWEFLIIKHNAKEYIAYKFHHSVADGLTVMQIPEMLFQNKSSPKLEPSRVSLLDKLDFIVKIPHLLFEMIRLLTNLQDVLQFDSGTEAAQFTSTQTLNLIDLKSISKKHEVQLQSVFATVYAGVIHRFLESSGRIIPECIGVPLPQLRPNRPDHFIGNHFNTMFLPIPLKNKSPLERLVSVESEIQKIHSSKMILINNVVQSLCSVLPYRLVRFIMDRTPEGYALSPVLLRNDCVYEGRAAAAIQSISGITTCNMGILSVLISYKDKLAWTITGSKNLFQTQEALDVLTSQYIEQEMAELQASVSDAAHSTIKSDHCEISII